MKIFGVSVMTIALVLAVAVGVRMFGAKIPLLNNVAAA